VEIAVRWRAVRGIRASDDYNDKAVRYSGCRFRAQTGRADSIARCYRSSS